ncbi:MAG: hypothetical protein RTU30_03925 [Candidatus Thorarchaeota archaeon]
MTEEIPARPGASTGVTVYWFVGLIALAMLLLPFTGLADSTIMTASSLVALIVAVTIGLTTLLRFTTFGLFREDQFHMMGVLISVGILVMALSEASAAAATSFPDVSIFPYMITSARVIALLLWVVGIVGYVRTSNSVLQFAFPNLWALVLILAIISIIVGLGNLGQPVDILPTRAGWYFVYSVSVGSLLASIFMQYRVLREGQMGRVMKLVLFGILSLYVHTLILWFTSFPLAAVFASLLSVECYILLGASFTLSHTIDESIG